MVAMSVIRRSSMKQPAVAQASPRNVEMSDSEALTPPTALKDHMGLYQAPRVERVAQFLQQYEGRRPIPVAEVLPVILMNYGEVEFRYARTWFEAGEDAPGRRGGPSLIGVGGGVGAGGVGFWSPPFTVTPIEGQGDNAPVGPQIFP